MKYMLLCYDDESAWENAGETVLKAAMDEAIGLAKGLKAEGKCPAVAPLHWSSSATCVRVRDGKRVITDGPFAETREQLGGFYLLDVDSMEEAIAIAEKHPGQRFGGVEVRPVREMDGLPTT